MAKLFFGFLAYVPISVAEKKKEKFGFPLDQDSVVEYHYGGDSESSWNSLPTVYPQIFIFWGLEES